MNITVGVEMYGKFIYCQFIETEKTSYFINHHGRNADLFAIYVKILQN